MSHPTFQSDSGNLHAIRALLTVLALGVVCVPAHGAEEDPFAANVRTTEPRTPEAQRATFRVPEGFEVQWVAGEPDIHKPMNLAFDAAGRLWVTTSREYPHAVAVGAEGRDRVMVFSDIGIDGRPGKVTTFATGLNIPIGVYPFRSASSLSDAARRSAGGLRELPAETWKAVVWSIPHVWLMEDTDGDGTADRKERLFGPFDHTRDTHGNQASFRRGFDGWLYATHGFNNDSHVAGADGHRVDLNSGNTYRMRLDGTRIEHHTWGQVNPFGLAWDPEGNLYSSDCHSDPIYLLQAGGYYPSFGKPHDGLGFAPNMMEKIRGTTAIDGMTYYADDLWPEEYRDSLLVGDVMMSRVFRDRAVLRGSARVARPEPDFVVCSDPWFRPVDMTLGPDGALYIADFYNRIIGHYEVPLQHPGRDRERGRIWRVVPTAKPLRAAALPSDAEGLIAELASPSLTRRMLAMNELADRYGESVQGRLRAVVEAPQSVFQRVHALWLLHRLGRLDAILIAQSMDATDRLVRIHTQRILADLLSQPARGMALESERRTAVVALAVRGLKDSDRTVRRCAAEALAVIADASLVDPLLAAYASAEVEDAHLRYGLRRALCTQLRMDGVMAEVLSRADFSADSLSVLAEVALAVRSEGAARLILRHLDRLPARGSHRAEALTHAARHVAPSDVPELMTAVRRSSAGNLGLELEWFRSIRQGTSQRGATLAAEAVEWGTDLAMRVLKSSREDRGWMAQPFDQTSGGVNPWDRQMRACADGREAALVSSHPKGENLTGILRSQDFEARGTLSYYVAGHDGPPDRPALGRNLVRLVDSRSGEVIRVARPPRSDVGQRVEWDLSGLGGRRVAVEVVDGDAGTAYAWIAVGRWTPALGDENADGPATRSSRLAAAAEIAGDVRAGSFLQELEQMAKSPREEPMVRAACARVIGGGDPVVRSAADVVADAALPWYWRAGLADVAFGAEREGLDSFLDRVWKDAPRRFQVRLAAIAGARADLAGSFIGQMAAGRAPAGLLLDGALRSRLRGAASDSDRAVLDELLTKLPEEDAALAALMEERRRGYATATDLDRVRGREVFVAACGACHRIGDEGGLVGPQLTGIGTRGVERLNEDILAPNRNVDRAFWSTTLELKDGEAMTGLFRREEGALLVLANAAGGEVQVAKSDVVRRQDSAQSVMPGNFGDALAPADYYHLLAFLLSTAQAAP